MTTTNSTKLALATADSKSKPNTKPQRRMARPAAVASTRPRDAAVSEETAGPNKSSPAPAPTTPTPAPRVTKADTVIALLRREQGATLPELITATSWLPHTTRAALTGIRKKGHVVEKSKRGDTTCYRILAVAA